jgi:transposase InsO family protein
MDLFFLPNSTLNKNFKYLLTCIDVYSRYVFVEKLKNKLGETVLEAFKKIIERAGKPKNVNVDMGAEFIYSSFQNYCLDNSLKLLYSNPEQDNINAIIERFYRTLRNNILKYAVANGKEYISELDDIIDNYNNTFHHTIKTD